MACSVESVVSKHAQTPGCGIQVENQVHLRSLKSSKPNITTKELKPIQSLGLNKDIRILQADKGKCTVVFDESKCKEK
jgi:hypothetical protein